MPRINDNALDRYLEAHNLDPDQVNEIQARYADAVANSDAATWSREQVYEWVDAQVEAIVGEDQPQPEGFSPTKFASEKADAAAEAAASAAGARADERAASVRSRYSTTNNYVVDAGPGMDPNIISTSLAVGAWVDERGNPINPKTGLPLDPGTEPVPADAATVWEQVRGQTFNMGTLNMPGFEERRTTNYIPRRAFTGTEPGTPSSGERSAKMLAKLGIMPPPGSGYNLDRPESTRFLTPSQAMALLGSMDEDYLLQLQHGMWDAGLYAAVGEGARPDWGKADPSTRAAFTQLFVEASLDPKTPISQILANLAEKNVLNLPDVPGAPGSSTGGAPDFKPEVASAETLGQMIDEVAQNLLGEYVDEDTKKTLIERLQSLEIGTQRKQYEQDVAGFQSGGGEGPAGIEDIDTFMSAIAGLESGGSYTAENASGAYGKFQIMPANWRPWATRAGLGPDAPRTPQNQEIVAKRIMMDYYAQFGNWRDVAVAWFAGPGAVGAAGAENRSDGNMTVRDYADSILNRMAGLKGQSGSIGATGGREFEPIERFDPAAEAQAALKAANPAAYVGHAWGERATEFFGLLQGVV